MDAQAGDQSPKGDLAEVGAVSTADCGHRQNHQVLKVNPKFGHGSPVN
jgi:hypothetical protein